MLSQTWGYHRHEVLIIHDIMRKPNSIIVLLYIFHIIHPQKQKRSVRPVRFWGEHSKGLSNQADVEHKCNICSRYCIYHVKFTSYCKLIECSRPIRFFIVSLMYNNNNNIQLTSVHVAAPHCILMKRNTVSDFQDMNFAIRTPINSLFKKSIDFLAEAEYSYFSADFRLRIFLWAFLAYSAWYFCFRMYCWFSVSSHAK